MGILRLFFVVFFFSFTNVSSASNDTEGLRCAFVKPLYMGASVTAALGREFLLYRPFVSLFYGAYNIPFGKNPGEIVASEYRSSVLERRLFRGGESRSPKIQREKNIAHKFTMKLFKSQLGAYQVKSVLDKKGRYSSVYKKSTVLFGIDLFYWDAVFDQCGYGEEKLNWKGQEEGSEAQALRLIESAAHDKKVLVMGTVPLDTSEKVFVDFKFSPWSPPVEACVKSINQVIRENCLAENLCFVSDFKEFNDQLYRGETVSLRDGREFEFYDVRPDGVHLSEMGSLIVAERIDDMLVEHKEEMKVLCKN